MAIAPLAVRRPGTSHAAKGEARPGELFAQADVERDVGGVRVHVQPQVLAVPVLHHERVVVVGVAALLREEQRGERSDAAPLQGLPCQSK